MADFRKLVLALAVLALIAVPASAQQFQCTASGAVPPVVRGEGVTEMVGDTLLTCTGSTGGADITGVNLQIFMNTSVTNRLAADGVTLTNAVLTVDGAAPGQAGRLVGSNSILWTNITIPATTATDTTRSIRITGVRANATQAPSAASGIPGQIFEFLSISGPTTIPLFPASVPVAYVQPGLTFSAAKAGRVPVATFQQCTGSVGVPSKASDVAATVTTGDFKLVYTETIINAFKTKDEEGIGADTATRLFARFTNVPTGAKIYVTSSDLSTSTASASAAFVTADGLVSTGWQEAALSGTTATATWEVTADAGGPDFEKLEFGVLVYFPANLSFTGATSATVQVAGGFAPISTTATASKTAAIPRFVDTSVPSDLFNIAACVTNLLFPYVTNAAGFDTGIAIVNTSKDTGVFDTTPQSGTCTVYYFGSMGNGSQVPGPQTTTEIAGGSMVAFLLSQGGVSGATNSAASFTGYVIARCNFQYAHGFAFISDLGGTKLAQGYLALVIPDKTAGAGRRSADPFTVAGTGSGEQLGY